MGFKPSFNAEKGTIKVMVRLSYFKGFEKTKSFESGALKYRTNGLIDPSTEDGKASIKVINDAIRHLCSTEWPGKELKNLKEAMGDGPKGRWPLFDGDKYVTDDGDVRDGYEGMRYVRLTNDRKPKYKNRRGEDIDIEDEGEDLFRSGYYAIAYFHLYAIKAKDKGGNGIFTTLDALQYFKKGEEFAGGGIDDDDIENLGDDDDDDDLGGKPAKKKAPSIDDDDDI